ncbi:MAG: flavodoxin family protein [Thermodesulfobacteriota bacterium]|nr:flavodoxin family protein [Thermodesulfobacteriota bacterium]
MKVLGILGSPRGRSGNTGQLLDRLIYKVKELGVEAELIVLKDLTINYCVGCDECRKVGNCKQKDDFLEVKEKILSADGIVMGSPVYAFQVTAQMKTLIDRLCSIGHYLPFQGKYGASVAVAGGVGEEDVIKYLNTFLHRFGAFVVGDMGAKAIDPGEFRDAAGAFKEASALGQELVNALREKREYPEQAAELIHFKEVLKNNVILTKGALWKAEYAYWEKMGWL